MPMANSSWGLDGEQLLGWATDFVRDRWVKAFNAHDGESAAALFAEHGEYWDPTTGLVPRVGIPQMVADLSALAPDHQFIVHPGTVTVMRSSADSVNLVFRWTYVAGGGRLRLPGIDFLEIEGDEVVRASTYLCQQQADEQTHGVATDVPSDTEAAIADDNSHLSATGQSDPSSADR